MIQPLEVLQNQRQKISDCILDLQRGLLDETNKLQHFQMELGTGKYDDALLQQQIDRGQDNLNQIQTVLADEELKLAQVDEQIKYCHNLIQKHGTKACLVQAVPHKYVVIEQFSSGHWRKRRCSECGTEERLGP